MVNDVLLWEQDVVQKIPSALQVNICLKNSGLTVSHYNCSYLSKWRAI